MACQECALHLVLCFRSNCERCGTPSIIPDMWCSLHRIAGNLEAQIQQLLQALQFILLKAPAC